jgi:hypothetical protein
MNIILLIFFQISINFEALKLEPTSSLLYITQEVENKRKYESLIKTFKSFYGNNFIFYLLKSNSFLFKHILFK